MAKIEVTLELAELLKRLASYAEMASNCAYGYWNSADEIYEKDEEAAYTLADHIKELLNG